MTFFKLYRKYAQILRTKGINASGYFLICYRFSYTLVTTQGFKSMYASRLLCYHLYILDYIKKNCKTF